MGGYNKTVALLEDRVETAKSDQAKLRWLKRYFIVVMESDQKESYKHLHKSLVERI